MKSKIIMAVYLFDKIKPVIFYIKFWWNRRKLCCKPGMKNTVSSRWFNILTTEHDFISFSRAPDHLRVTSAVKVSTCYPLWRYTNIFTFLWRRNPILAIFVTGTPAISSCLPAFFSYHLVVVQKISQSFGIIQSGCRLLVKK